MLRTIFAFRFAYDAVSVVVNRANTWGAQMAQVSFRFWNGSRWPSSDRR